MMYQQLILITEDPELKKLFRGSKDKWTIIDEKGQEYLVDAILLFYGLPITFFKANLVTIFLINPGL